MKESFLTPYIPLEIGNDLGYTIKVFDWLLPEDHTIYISNKRSMRNITVANLIKSIENLFVCEGTSIDQANEKGKVIYHVVQIDVFFWIIHTHNDEKDEIPLKPFSSKIYYRIPVCNTNRTYKNCV